MQNLMLELQGETEKNKARVDQLNSEIPSYRERLLYEEEKRNLDLSFKQGKCEYLYKYKASVDKLVESLAELEVTNRALSLIAK